MNAPVSVIGLGQMGSALADAFLSKGHDTTVWNRSPHRSEALVARGAKPAATLGDAFAASPLVVMCVSDYQAASQVLESAGDALAGRVLVNLTSGTPQQARDLALWAEQRNVEYLVGAAMSGTELVGDPQALFLFSGSPGAYAAHQTTLEALGNAVHLGSDPGLAPLYDTALFGFTWAALAGFYHAVALIGTENVGPVPFASVVAEHLPFIALLMGKHAQQMEQGTYPDDDGSLQIHAAAIDHLVTTSRDQGIGDDLPGFLKVLLDSGVAAGHGNDGIASMMETMRAAKSR